MCGGGAAEGGGRTAEKCTDRKLRCKRIRGVQSALAFENVYKIRRSLTMSATDPLIHLSDVKKVFYTDEVETHALSGIHLDIKKGE